MKNTYISRYFALAYIFVMAFMMINVSECNTSQLIAVTSPAEGLVTNVCQPLKMTFPSGKKPQMFVLMNYFDITAIVREYTTSTGVSVPAERLCPYHGEGTNLIQITAWTTSSSQIEDRRFVYDTQSPRIDVTSMDPIDGNPGLIRISGDVIDAGGAESLKINNFSIPLSNGHFSAQITQSEFFTFEAADIFGAMTKYTVAQSETLVSEALGVRLNESAFEDIAVYITSYMGDLSGLCLGLTEFNPIQTGSIQDGENTISYEINVTSSTCGLPYAILHPSTAADQNAMLSGLAIPNLQMTVEISGLIETPDGSSPYRGLVYLSADLAEVLDTVDLTVQGNQLVVTAQTVTAELTHFSMTTEDIPEGMEALINPQEIETMFEEALAQAVSGVLTSTVDQLVAMINQGFLTTEVNGFTLDLAILPQSILLNNGRMTYFSKASASTDDVDPNVSFFPGSFYTSDIAPNFDNISPAQYSLYDLAMTLSDDFINQFFYVLYQTGTLNEEVLVDIPDDPTVELLLALFGVDSSAEQLKVNLESLVPPAMRFDQFDANDTAALNWQDLLVNIAAVSNSGDEDILAVLVSSIIPLIIKVTDHNTILIQLSEETAITIESVPNSDYSIPTAAIEDALNTIIASAVQEINNAIPEIPLPTFEEGIQYTVLEINTNMDGQGGFMTVFANLE